MPKKKIHNKKEVALIISMFMNFFLHYLNADFEALFRSPQKETLILSNQILNFENKIFFIAHCASSPATAAN